MKNTGGGGGGIEVFQFILLNRILATNCLDRQISIGFAMGRRSWAKLLLTVLISGTIWTLSDRVSQQQQQQIYLYPTVDNLTIQFTASFCLGEHIVMQNNVKL